MIRDIMFNDLFNGIGKLFSKAGRNDTCSIDGLDLDKDSNLKKEYKHLQEIYSKEYKEIRDRITGHLDMSTLVKMETKIVKFEEIEDFLILIKAFLEKAIPNHKDIFQVELFNIEDKRKQYDIQLKSWLYEILLLYGIEKK